MRRTTLSPLMWVGVVFVTAAALGAQREGPVSTRSETGDRRAEAATPDSIDGRTSLRTAGPSAEGQIPRLMKFSGLVRDLAGKPLTGPIEVTFALYLEEAGGAPLWFETQTVEADSLGHYTALLGAMTPAGLPAELFTSAEAHWLGVQAGNLPEQARVLLVSVPYALKAADAETLGGKPASAFQLAPSEAASSADDGKKTSPSASSTPSGTGKKAVTGSSTGTKALTTTGPSTFTCSSTTPCVSVSQSSTGIGLQATAKILGVFGVANATTGATYGVRGQTPSTTGRGVFGYATATTGGTIGVYGLAPSTSAVAVLGDATATTGGTRGVLGRTPSTSGMGVWGQATATSGSTTGLRGDVWSASGTAGYFDNRAGGKILSGRRNGVEKFSVDGSGKVVAGAGEFTGTIVGVFGSGSNFGLYGYSPSVLGGAAGTLGWEDATTGVVYGVSGGTNSATDEAAGVNGFEGAATGRVSGVNGGTNSTTTGAAGVKGYEGATTGEVYGVYGQTNSTTTWAAGVNGFELATTGEVRGVNGYTVSTTDGAAGIVGSEGATTGVVFGVIGTTPSTTDGATALFGSEDATTGQVYGVRGETPSTSGFGVAGNAYAGSGSTVGVEGIVASSEGVAGLFNNGASGNILIGQAAGGNVFRVDGTGKGYFNGGTQTGGADFAESMAVRGDRTRYAPGDVLVIDSATDRHVALSRRPYSTLVAGIYSTKPGVLATPYVLDDPHLKSEVPLAVVGIVPCKVTTENGPIARGDLIVTSSTPGHAMKGTDRSRMLGAIVGKALEPLASGAGVIQVLVTLQ